LWCAKTAHGEDADLISRISHGNSARAVPAQSTARQSLAKNDRAQELTLADFTVKDAGDSNPLGLDPRVFIAYEIRGIAFAQFSSARFSCLDFVLNDS
jgi:hypothetical protein